MKLYKFDPMQAARQALDPCCFDRVAIDEYVAKVDAELTLNTRVMLGREK